MLTILFVSLSSTQKQQAYVSPSDEIMSPCSKKLSDIKGKRFKKYAFFSALSVMPDATAFRINLNWIGLTANGFLFACLISAGKPQSLLAKLGKKNIEQSSLAANSDKEGAQAQA